MMVIDKKFLGGIFFLGGIGFGLLDKIGVIFFFFVLFLIGFKCLVIIDLIVEKKIEKVLVFSGLLVSKLLEKDKDKEKGKFLIFFFVFSVGLIMLGLFMMLIFGFGVVSSIGKFVFGFVVVFFKIFGVVDLKLLNGLKFILLGLGSGFIVSFVFVMFFVIKFLSILGSSVFCLIGLVSFFNLFVVQDIGGIGVFGVLVVVVIGGVFVFGGGYGFYKVGLFEVMLEIDL